jgi:hypothetical protein
MKMQQSRGLQDDGGPQNARRPHHESAQTGDDAIGRPKIGSPLPTAIQNQDLMSQQHGLGNHRPEATGLTNADNSDDRMQKKSENVAHLQDRIKLKKPQNPWRLQNSPRTRQHR